MADGMLTIDAVSPDPKLLARAVDLLRTGKLVAFPTETVYGLGANGLDAVAVERIYQAKGRPANNPVILHVSNLEQAQLLTCAWSNLAQQLADRFWPGPLTLVLPKSDLVPEIVTAGGPTVAMRFPAHPLARRLIEVAGCPVAAPSANRSGELSPTRAEHVWKSLGDRVDLILDAGPTSQGIESTVLDLSVHPPRLLRPGPITPSQVRTICEVQAGMSIPNEGGLKSPGMLDRHYAPRTPLRLISSKQVQDSETKQERRGLITFQDFLSDGTQAIVAMPLNPEIYSANLYAVLHQLDQQNLAYIEVELPPNTEAWQAIHDRLLRASRK